MDHVRCEACNLNLRHESDPGRLSELRTAVAAGRYQIDSSVVAECLLLEHLLFLVL